MAHFTTLIMISLAAMAFATVRVPAQETSETCPAGIVVDETQPQRCAYNVTIFEIDSTKTYDFFDWTTDVALYNFPFPVGTVLGFQVNQEGFSRFARLGPDETHSDYLRVAHRYDIYSENRTKDYDNQNVVTDKYAVYRWTHLVPSLFDQRRSWIKAHGVWVSHHPRFAPDEALANELADKTLAAMKGAQVKREEKRRQEQSKQIHVPPRPWTLRPELY